MEHGAGSPIGHALCAQSAIGWVRSRIQINSMLVPSKHCHTLQHTLTQDTACTRYKAVTRVHWHTGSCGSADAAGRVWYVTPRYDVTALQTDEAPSPGVLPSAHGPAPIVYTDVMSSFHTNTSPCDTATQPCTGAAPVPAIRQDDVRSPRQRRKPNATALSAAEPSRAPGPFRTRRLSGNCQCNCKRGAGRHRRQHSSHYGAAFAGALFIRFSILRIRQPMLDMSSSRARAQIIHTPVFHLTMGEPGHDVECCLCVCAGLCCVCAQVPAFPVMIGKMVTMPHPS